MKNRVSNLALGFSVVAGVSMSAPFAAAGIAGVSGMTTWLTTPPASAMPGALTGFTASAWDEQQKVTLSIIADMVNNPGSSTAPVPGPLSGTFDSHFIHWEGVAGAVGVLGTVTFTAPIVGVMFTPLGLDNTDGPAGASGTVYPTTYPFRGLSSVPPSFVTINGNVLTFDFKAMAPSVDLSQVRVFTAVPAPGAASLALVGLAAAGRRRRRA